MTTQTPGTSPLPPRGSDGVVGGEVVAERVEGVAEGSVVEPVDVVARAVLAVPGVHSLHAGLAGSAATFLPGRRVAGIALRESGTEVHVVVEIGRDVRATAAAVHAAVTALGAATAPQPVHVHVGDLAAPRA
ncbi:hypothetical protein [Quadrisphaera sp. INWT6]|uniref:hypothetical protein n=1 Tax=Quadrisphaera sp. INWT6 TaxID=2596917 RepID=UPI0018928389|nr:hypothetical protein [Quadrisphaera sp. INWT6]MBF5082931.1 hypothetical protein [Quadrisphaera sp. INWT6]